MAKEKEVKKTLAEITKELEKEYGKGSVIHGSAVEDYTDVIPTGSLGLDIALGIKGLPLGKIVEIIGWESSGKSTLTQHIIANAQKKGLKCLLIDGENSLSKEYASNPNIGINLDDLYLVQLDESCGEGAYNKMERLISSGEINVCVIDSYNSLKPRKIVVDGEIGESAIGLHSRMMGQVMDKINFLSKKYNCLFILIGQLRQAIGIIYGSNEVTQGGNSIRFFSHIRLEVKRSTTNANSVMEGDTKLGNKTTVKVLKNKMSPPFLSASFNIIYSEGIDKVSELIEIANEYEVLKVWGKKTTYKGTEYVTDEFPQLIKDNPEFYEEIKSQVLAKLNSPKLEESTPE